MTYREVFNSVIKGAQSSAMKKVAAKLGLTQLNKLMSEYDDVPTYKRIAQWLHGDVKSLHVPDMFAKEPTPLPVLDFLNKGTRENIQRQYEKHMLRDHSWANPNIKRHVTGLKRALDDAYEYGGSNIMGLVHRHKNDGYIVGNFNYGADGIGDVFIGSHFAPRNIVSGVRMMKDISRSNHPVVFAVPEKQAGMLERLGFRRNGVVPQIFQGNIVMKNVMMNDAALPYRQRLIDSFKNGYV